MFRFFSLMFSFLERPQKKCLSHHVSAVENKTCQRLDPALLHLRLEWLDVRVHPKRRQITEAELQLMAQAQLRFSIASDGGETTLTSVLPSTWAKSRADSQKEEDLMKHRSDLSVKEQSWKLREQFAFSYGEADWDVLPLWAHVASVCIAQFHSLLFMILACLSILFLFLRL